MMTEEESVREELLDKPIKKENKNEPDNYLFIVLFYLLGAACFIPHNFYVTANKYWMYKFRDPSTPFNDTDVSEKTPLQGKFTAYMGMAGNIGLVTAVLATLVFLKKISIRKKIVTSMSSLLVLFVITFIFIFVDTDSWQTGFFVISLIISGLLGACTLILLISLFQLNSRFPPRCLAAQLAGQSVCGILASVIQIITLLVTSIKGTAALYYAIAIIVIGGVMIAYLVILNNSEEFQRKLEDKPTEDSEEKQKVDFAMIRRVLAKLPLIIASFVMCVGATGIMNPGLTTLIESSGKGTSAWNDTFFLPVCVFLSFNVFDFIGRESSNYCSKFHNKYAIFIASIIRLILCPLLLLCNLQPRHHLPVVFHDDAYFIVFLILLAFSSGYLGNIVVLLLTDLCEPEEKMVGMFIIIGVMIVLVPIFSVVSSLLISVI